MELSRQNRGVLLLTPPNAQLMIVGKAPFTRIRPICLDSGGIKTREGRFVMNRSFESILTREFLQQTYYDEKKFQAEIADIVGCSTATVRHYMRKYNMKGDRTRGHPKQGPGRRGPASNRWKGGRVVEKSGYIKVYVGHKDGRTRYRREHMLVWEAANGPIPKGWEIHHVNGVKTDNRLENLQALPPEKHAKVISELRKRIYQLIQENDELRAKIERLSK